MKSFALAVFLCYHLLSLIGGAEAGTCQCFNETFLGAGLNFSVLGNAVSNTGTNTNVTYSVGSSPGPTTGTPINMENGTVHENDPMAIQALSDIQAAYNIVQNLTATAAIGGDMNGKTLVPGIYFSGGALANTGTLILDSGGDTNGTFLFQLAAAYTPAAGSRMLAINGTRGRNVIWAVGGALSTGAGSSLIGTFLTVGAITLGAGAGLEGRALSLAAVTLSNNNITSAPEPTATGSPRCYCYNTSAASDLIPSMSFMLMGFILFVVTPFLSHYALGS
jgi:hypothetical protein